MKKDHSLAICFCCEPASAYLIWFASTTKNRQRLSEGNLAFGRYQSKISLNSRSKILLSKFLIEL